MNELSELYTPLTIPYGDGLCLESPLTFIREGKSLLNRVNMDIHTQEQVDQAKRDAKAIREIEVRLGNTSEEIISSNVNIKSSVDALTEVQHFAKEVRLYLEKSTKEWDRLAKQDAIDMGNKLYEASVVQLEAEIAPFKLPVYELRLDQAIKGCRSRDSMNQRIHARLAEAVDKLNEWLVTAKDNLAQGLHDTLPTEYVQYKLYSSKDIFRDAMIAFTKHQDAEVIPGTIGDGVRKQAEPTSPERIIEPRLAVQVWVNGEMHEECSSDQALMLVDNLLGGLSAGDEILLKVMF